MKNQDNIGSVKKAEERLCFPPNALINTCISIKYSHAVQDSFNYLPLFKDLNFKEKFIF